VTSHAAVCIDNDLASGKPSVTHGTANHKAPSGIDVIFGVLVEQMLGKRSLDDVLQHFGAQSTIVYSFGMLRRDHDSIHADRLVIGVVFNCDLGFAVRPEKIEGTILANF
jgi:hypothetical protein